MSAGPSSSRLAKRKRDDAPTPNELRALVDLGDAGAAATLIKRDSALSRLRLEIAQMRDPRESDRKPYRWFAQSTVGMLSLDLGRDQMMQMGVLVMQCINAAGLTFEGNPALFHEQRAFELFGLPGTPCEQQGYDTWPAATIIALAKNPDAPETAKKAKREIRARYHAHSAFSRFVDESRAGIEMPEFPNMSLADIATKCPHVRLVTLAAKLLDLRPILQARAPGTDASEFAEAIKDTVLTELLGINPGNAFGLAHFRDSATESE